MSRMEQKLHALTLRPATPADLPTLQHWDQQPHVIESDPNDDWNWGVELQRNPSWREQLIAEVDNRPVGFLQIIDPAKEDSHYWGDVPDNLRAIDIWIGEEADTGKGYGTQMITLAINRCFSNPNVTAILIDPLEANKKAQRFYEKLGFRFMKKRRFGLDNCVVMQLDRQRWQKSLQAKENTD
jgi:aminoglycoside 6'-N-acetyltransferase